MLATPYNQHLGAVRGEEQGVGHDYFGHRGNERSFLNAVSFNACIITDSRRLRESLRRQQGFRR